MQLNADFMDNRLLFDMHGLDGLSVEHIVNCHPIIIIQLTCMFNCMLQLGYVPDAFGTGVLFL